MESAITKPHMKACCAKSPAFQCTNCKQAKYCSRECQRENWPQHKGACKELVQMHKYAENFAATALKNKAFLAFTTCMYEHFKKKTAMAGKLIVEYYPNAAEVIGVANIEPLLFSADTAVDITSNDKSGNDTSGNDTSGNDTSGNDKSGSKIACVIGFVSCDAGEYMSVYCAGSEIFEILSVENPTEPKFAELVVARHDFNFDRLTDAPVTLVVDSVYCGICIQ